MTIAPLLAVPTSLRRVIDAEVAIIKHVRASALQDPFWESITIHYASDEVTVTVVNLAEDVRVGDGFDRELVHDVGDHIAFLRSHAQFAVSERAAGPYIPSLTVYRDGDTARERMLEGKPIR